MKVDKYCEAARMKAGLDLVWAIRLLWLIIVANAVVSFTTVAAILFVPDPPIQLLSLVVPEEPAEVAGLLEVGQVTVLLLYGVLSLSMSAFLAAVIRGYRQSYILQSRTLRKKTTIRFLVTASFTAAFLGTRTLVALSGIVGSKSSGHVGRVPIVELWVQGYHIHHYFIGVALLSLVGGLVVFRESYSRYVVAVLYGLGLGIFVDEVGMLLTGGNYFAVSTYIVAVLLEALFLVGFYWELRTHTQ